MSARHPRNDDERQVLADENADIGRAIANALQPRGTDGRNLLDRMRAQLAGTPGAQSYDAPRVGGHTTRTWCDFHQKSPCYDDGSGCAQQYIVNTATDSTGETAAGLADPEGRGDEARRDLAAWDELAYQIHVAMLSQQRIAVKYLPRPPRSSEQLLAAEEENSRDPGCESCRRCTRADGELAWVEVYRTSDVRTGDGKNPETARLDKPRGLCRGCYDEVIALVPPGSRFTLAQALPLRKVRYRLEHGKRGRIHEYELQGNVIQEAS